MKPLRRRAYADNFDQRARAQKEIDGWRCVQCGTEQYTIFAPSMDSLNIIIDPELDHPKMTFLHAAHPNMDPANPEAELMTLCPTCHGRRDYRHRQREAETHLERLRHMLQLYGPQLDRWYQSKNNRKRGTR